MATRAWDVRAIFTFIAPSLALGGATDLGGVATGDVINTVIVGVFQPAGFFPLIETN